MKRLLINFAGQVFILLTRALIEMVGIVLVAGEGKGTWGEVFKILDSEPWTCAYVITAPFFEQKFREKYSGKAPLTILSLEESKPLSTMVQDLANAFKTLTDDVALNLISGSGKQHMAVLAGLLKAGVGIRLVTVNENGITEI